MDTNSDAVIKSDITSSVAQGENALGKIHVCSTSSSVEVEAAAVLMSLPTSTNEMETTPVTFANLEAYQQQHTGFCESSTSVPTTYEEDTHSQQLYYDHHDSNYNYDDGYVDHNYDSRPESMHQDPMTEEPGRRFQFADRDPRSDFPSTLWYHRKQSFCSTSDSSVGSSSFHYPYQDFARYNIAEEQNQRHAEVASPRFQLTEEPPKVDFPHQPYRHKTSYCSSSDSSVGSTDSSTLYENATGPWFPGSVSLALEEDEEVLSPLHCFMRKYCVEAFSATPQDVATPRYGKAHGGKIMLGQVGIRCIHCKHRQQGRAERAVCFPSSLKNIYHSMETWQRRHSAVCTDLPDWIQKQLKELMESSRSSAGGRRQYWQDAAKRLGMVDTPCGVRFARPPGLEMEPNTSEPGDGSAMQEEPEEVNIPLLSEEDRPLVNDYLFLLMSQMETCQFTQEDRTGGRSKIKVQEIGFPGMQCRHCCGKAGFGRYFPQSAHALALANSDRNIFNHLSKCRKCPEEIKEQLVTMQQEQQSGPKNKRGSRKLFFTRVWERMHGSSNDQTSAEVAATAESIASAWLTNL